MKKNHKRDINIFKGFAREISLKTRIVKSKKIYSRKNKKRYNDDTSEYN